MVENVIVKVANIYRMDLWKSNPKDVLYRKAKSHEFPNLENKWGSTQISKEVDRKFKSPRYLRDCSLYDMNNPKKKKSGP